MTGSASQNVGRVALVSRGAALAPLDTQARADFLQERIGLLARLGFSLICFFLVAGTLHRAVFLGVGLLVDGSVDFPLVAHLGLMALLATVWVSTRRRAWGAGALPWLDAGLVTLILSTQAVLLRELRLSHLHQLHLMAILGALCILMCRAVIVPSRPQLTFVVGVFGVVPTLIISYLDGRTRGVAAETVSFACLWSVVALVLTTFTSQVIYGLRQSVSRAQQLGQYVIEKKIGEGGMGEVYLARHTLLRRPTAIKLLPPERAGERTVARFEREVRATSRLSHPNTVAIYDYGRTADGVFYYAMEHLDGMDLQHLVEQHGPLPPGRVVHILLQIAGALNEAHGRGLVHRDLKPANVFLCERGGQQDTVKVLDFGLVKETGSDSSGPAQTDVNALIGTPRYLAPEAIHSPSEVDARSDLYAVGAIAYFLLTGCDVFEATSVVALCIAHLHEKPVPPAQRLERELPADLEALVLGCLEKVPENRPASAAALRHALLACNVPTWAPDDADAWWERCSKSPEPCTAPRLERAAS
jgi:eukaryotic-like serine/threonine-protein kinase